MFIVCEFSPPVIKADTEMKNFLAPFPSSLFTDLLFQNGPVSVVNNSMRFSNQVFWVFLEVGKIPEFLHPQLWGHMEK